ncbi:hypothetical protein SAMN02800692_2026 [Luteibacter sp. UNC138MFCol5.1]|uniref:hypothetical protein n=1 Tax=Luteibacter sp. UNC138MFCol5.1 TaxID=1502774 RepID=UPI0008B75E8A|nr:hypothetical protein [Luteibacter sp. UNC138MFCol5.1]SEO76906.1 hypothetical protein SAMN02800692_2026 [Luteibacter sp. UNC138MFCol5.1]
MSAYTDQQREDAIEEMMGMHRYVEDFLFEGEADPTQLVSLLMVRDLPLRTRDHRDDALADAYDAQREMFSDAFRAFAYRTQAGQPHSRVDMFLDHQHAIHMEYAA